jgi:sigma-B regulation protein RsbU (phosphoserine phosphatase)
MFQILVIDDDPTTRLLLARILKNQGYRVTVASDGRAGIVQAQQLHPAMIVCDWMMPGMDGLEVCRQLKADPQLSTTFFILLTARTAIEDRVKGLDTGADDFLSKPVEMNELKARVRAGLRLHQLSQDLQTQKQILEAELSEAAEYVRSLLPPPLTHPVTIESRFIPSRQLGGDCFDYYWLDSESLVIYLLDVSGHGLGAALPSVSVLNLLRSQSLPGMNYHQPDQVLSRLNQSFQMSNHNDKYFTIWYGVYNQVKRQLVYASAGHPPALLLSGTSGETIEIKKLKTSGLPIGILPDAKFVTGCCDIEELSTLYIYSDGVYEINQPGSTQSLEAFIQVLVNCRKTDTYYLDQVLHQIRSLNAKDFFDDDLSLLQINFN